MIQDRVLFRFVFTFALLIGNKSLSQERNCATLNFQCEKKLLSLVEYDTNVEEVKKLIADGVDVNYRDKSNLTSLISAAYYRADEMVDLLIEAGAKMDVQTNTGNTALMVTTMWNPHAHGEWREAYQIMRNLTLKGANLNLQNKHGHTVTMLVGGGFCYGSMGYIDGCILDRFIENNANLNLQDTDGNSVLHFVLESNSPNYFISYQANALINAGINLNLQNKYGYSPLMLMVKYSDIRIIELAIAKDINLNLRNQDGITALTMAKNLNRADVVDVLIKAGAIE